MKIADAIRAIWADLMTPSGYGTPYTAATSAIAHAVLGACFGWWGITFALVYFVVKEWPDIKRGGAWLDSLEDATMVALGTFYGPWWWPLLMLSCGGLVMLSRQIRGRV